MDPPQGVISLKELCSRTAVDIMISTMAIDNWHEPFTHGKMFLSENSFDKLLNFISINLTQLKNAQALLTSKDLEVILKREDVNATKADLHHFLRQVKNLPEEKRKKLEKIMESVSRKPPEILILVGGIETGGYLSGIDTFNCLSGSWLEVEVPELRLPEGVHSHQVEFIDNKVYVVGGERDGFIERFIVSRQFVKQIVSLLLQLELKDTSLFRSWWHGLGGETVHEGEAQIVCDHNHQQQVACLQSLVISFLQYSHKAGFPGRLWWHLVVPQLL